MSGSMNELVRYLWQVMEPYHALVYFAWEKKDRFEAIGLKGGWMAYFASRAAALGPVGHEVVTALFFNFHPARVARSIPDAWNFAAPEKIIMTRLEVVDAALRRLFGHRVESPEIAEAADLALRAALAGEVAGRPLYASHAALPVPETPHLKLWFACTALREHRGDGHVACLTEAGLDGCEANVLAAAVGAVNADVQKSFRGWSDDEWSDAEARLTERGWIDESGLTDAGRTAKNGIEDATDRLAAGPYAALGRSDSERLATLMADLTRVLVDGGDITYPNPMGLTAPARPS
jgi:hypothetical protein